MKYSNNERARIAANILINLSKQSTFKSSLNRMKNGIINKGVIKLLSNSEILTNSQKVINNNDIMKTVAYFLFATEKLLGVLKYD